MSVGVICWGIFIGMVGLILLRYGKKKSDGLAMITGIVLMAYPYFFNSLGWAIATGVLILAAYFFLNKFWF